AAAGREEAPAGTEAGPADAAARAAALFDGSAARSPAAAVSAPAGLTVGEVGHRGSARRRDWSVDGAAVEYVGGGGIKDVLAHPRSPDHVLALFNQHLRPDPSISRTERDVELAGRRRLAGLGVAPAVAVSGALRETRDKGSQTIHYLVVEKVSGTTLAEASEADLPLVRALFKSLTEARLRLTDRVHLLDNLMVGTTASKRARQAWVVDAEGVEAAAPRGLLESWRGHPDELAAYYDGLYREVAAELRRRR
ncbi:MAG: hypothetical protein HY928_07580, partial [Elusimicrobia bacterium]|nr:hypothetical protein [Elusimicrobiota bacterium]